jgi:hypothetical protein
MLVNKLTDCCLFFHKFLILFLGIEKRNKKRFNLEIRETKENIKRNNKKSTENNVKADNMVSRRVIGLFLLFFCFLLVVLLEGHDPHLFSQTNTPQLFTKDHFDYPLSLSNNVIRNCSIGVDGEGTMYG